jgi:hypothetical protein
MRVAFLAVLVLVGTIGCQPSPPPEDVARRFYQLVDSGRQDPALSLRSELLSLLSAASRDPFEKCARSGEQSALLWASPLTAPQCLLISGFDAPRGEYEFVAIAAGTVRATLEARSGRDRRYVELVNEDGWKIDVPATVERNRSAPPQ